MGRPPKEKEESKPEMDQIDEILNSKAAEGKHFGSRAGDEIKFQVKVSTGSFLFDHLLDGGFRTGSWARFYGEPESGKTSMGLCWGKQWQDAFKEDGFILIINAEGRLTRELIDRSGISTEKHHFRIIDTNNADFACDTVEKLVQNNPNKKKYFVIIDSTDALARDKDLDKTIGEGEKMGGTATILSTYGRRMSILFNCNDHFGFFTSQVRDKVNTYSPTAPGKDASGGNAPRFYSSLIGEIKKPWSETLIFEDPSDTKSKIIGRLTTIKMIKTPNEKTGQILQFPIKYGLKGGVWRSYEAMEVSKAWGYYVQKKAWFVVPENKATELQSNNIKFESNIQGEKGLRDYFENNPELCNYIFNHVKELAFP